MKATIVNTLITLIGLTVTPSAVFGQAPVYLTQWGTYGSAPGSFYLPTGVAVDRADNVFVSEDQNNRIQKFTSTGEFLTMWGSPGSGPGQFNSPVGIAVDPDGNVYVADRYNYRIQKFTGSGIFLTQWGTYGRGERTVHGRGLNRCGPQR